MGSNEVLRLVLIQHSFFFSLYVEKLTKLMEAQLNFQSLIINQNTKYKDS